MQTRRSRRTADYRCRIGATQRCAASPAHDDQWARQAPGRRTAEAGRRTRVLRPKPLGAPTLVAQTGSLLYRRMAFGKAQLSLVRFEPPITRRLSICETAEFHSALRRRANALGQSRKSIAHSLRCDYEELRRHSWIDADRLAEIA